MFLLLLYKDVNDPYLNFKINIYCDKHVQQVINITSLSLFARLL